MVSISDNIVSIKSQGKHDGYIQIHSFRFYWKGKLQSISWFIWFATDEHNPNCNQCWYLSVRAQIISSKLLVPVKPFRKRNWLTIFLGSNFFLTWFPQCSCFNAVSKSQMSLPIIPTLFWKNKDLKSINNNDKKKRFAIFAISKIGCKSWGKVWEDFLISLCEQICKILPGTWAELYFSMGLSELGSRERGRGFERATGSFVLKWNNDFKECTWKNLLNAHLLI